MTIAVSNGPFRVLITGSAEGPQGVGVQTAALDAAGNLVLILSDGTRLPPVSLASAVASSALSAGTGVTIDGQTIATLDGSLLQRST